MDLSNCRVADPPISSINWAIVTGEYPLQTGGVSDYTHLVAVGLAQRRDKVDVWAPSTAEVNALANSVGVHRLPDHFGARARRQLSRALAQLPVDARLLVQYVPQAYGRKGMNVPFCFWLWRRRHLRPIDVMFHEVATPWEKRTSLAALRLNVLALVTRLMAWLVGHAAERIYVSVPAWRKLLKGYVPQGEFAQIEWLPVPSTVPTEVDAEIVTNLRNDLLQRANAAFLLGHFGTFGGHIAAGLRQVLPPALKKLPTASAVLIGRGSTKFVEELAAAFPELRDRMMAAGMIEPAIVSQHLAACDCLVQPYLDGISSRRTSAMAGLALGRPIVTTFGFLSEPIWKESKAVRLVSSFSEMPAAIAEVLAEPQERARLSHAAAALYRQRFDIQHTIDALRSGATGQVSAA